MDEKKLHTQECQLKHVGENMRCNLLQRRSTGKTTGCSKHLRHITIENNRMFQTLVTYCHWKQQSLPNTCDISPLKTTECSKHLWHITIEDTRVFQTLATYCHCIMQFYFLVQNYVTPPFIPPPNKTKKFWPPNQQRLSMLPQNTVKPVYNGHFLDH